MTENEQRWESFQTEDAEYIIVAFGLPSRSAKNAIKQMRARGEKVGLIRRFPYGHSRIKRLNRQRQLLPI